MDLERLGASELAERFTGWYIEYSGDPAPTSLRHHYVAYRAFVRAKVSCLRCRQGDPRAADEAQQLAAMALQHLHVGAATLVLIGGLPGTGRAAPTCSRTERHPSPGRSRSTPRCGYPGASARQLTPHLRRS